MELVCQEGLSDRCQSLVAASCSVAQTYLYVLAFLRFQADHLDGNHVAKAVFIAVHECLPDSRESAGPNNPPQNIPVNYKTLFVQRCRGGRLRRVGKRRQKGGGW